MSVKEEVHRMVEELCEADLLTVKRRLRGRCRSSPSSCWKCCRSWRIATGTSGRTTTTTLVPHAYVGQEVEAYLGERVVQIYQGVGILTTHARSLGRGEWVTRPEHAPPEKRFELARGHAGQCLRLRASSPALTESDDREAPALVARLADTDPVARLRLYAGAVRHWLGRGSEGVACKDSSSLRARYPPP